MGLIARWTISNPPSHAREDYWRTSVMRPVRCGSALHRDEVEVVPASALEGAVDLLREARAFLDTRHGPDGKLRRPENLIERIDSLTGGSR